MQRPTYTDAGGNIPLSGIAAFELIDCQLCQVRELIDKQLTVPSKAGDLKPLLEYVSTRSGKMLRPGLVLLAGGCCGKIIDEHIRVAAIVEMIHNATLLHDDVIDEGQKRRGLPTANSLWGNESAVLLGDFLLSRAFKMSAELKPQVARVIAATAIRVCEGELRQVSQRRNWQLSESEYIDIITEKSAALFSGCCYLGGLLARASEAQVQSLADFGLNAGIAFQITDDLLDIIGDENQTGKTLGSDVSKHKLTLAVIHLLGSVDDPAPIRRSLSSIGAGLAEMLSRYGSLEYARGRAQEFAGRAVGALAGLKESDAKGALIEAAKFMAGRAV